MGGFTAAFSLLAETYGWSLKAMKKMTLRELRAFTVAARLSNKAKDMRERSYLSWQTRTLASFMALTVPLEKKGAEHPILGAAQVVSIDEIEREYLQSMINAPHKTTTKENAPGSFERLTGGAFGA